MNEIYKTSYTHLAPGDSPSLILDNHKVHKGHKEIMHLPQEAAIEEIGIHSLKEIEGHRISGSIFIQYRCPIHNKNGKAVDVIVNRFHLPVCLFSNDERPDLRKLTIVEIEDLFYLEVDKVFQKLSTPFGRIE